MQADTRTTVSPYLAVTAPLACFAILPVSRIRLRPPTSSVTWCGAGMRLFSVMILPLAHLQRSSLAGTSLHSMEEKKQVCRGRQPVASYTNRKRAYAHSHRQNTFTPNRFTTGGQTPLGICTFVSLQVLPHSAGSELLAQAKAFNNLVIPIRVSPV